MATATLRKNHGYAALFVALSWWGLMPLYYWQLKAVSATEMLAHRIFWSFVLLSCAVLASPALRSQIGGRRDFAISVLPAILLSGNWIVYIFSATSGNALQASLGYFLNPLMSAALGVIFFSERINRLKGAALFLGCIGTATQCYSQGGLPILAILLTASFSLLGLTRKAWPTNNAVVSTWRETVVMLPFATAFFVFSTINGDLAFLNQGLVSARLMILAGPLTVVPMALHAYAMPRVSMTESAVMQYATPTITFVLALTVFHESMGTLDLIGFSFIWIGLALAAYASVKRQPLCAKAA